MSKKNHRSHRAHYSREVNSDSEDFHGQEQRHRAYSHDQLNQKDFQRSQGRPPELKGKALGLYYRDLNRKKREEKGEKQSSSRPSKQERHFFSFPDSAEKDIRRIIMAAREATSLSPSINDKYSQNNLFKKKFDEIVSGNIQDSLDQSMAVNFILINNERLNDQLKNELIVKKVQPHYQSMFKFRMKLPVYKNRHEILKLLDEHQVILISGETGCGKTTQISQYILDDAIQKGKGSTVKIVCTQPRRISAFSVAERVAAERIETIGHSVGYQIRLEKVRCRDHGSILFCTTGVLLRFMQSDPALRDYSHIILDEIHERSSETDFILCLLKQVIRKRSDVKVILMSATLNDQKFSKYYNNCPLIRIPGFIYPVTEYYLEDILKLTKFKFGNSRKALPLELTSIHDRIKPLLLQELNRKNFPSYVTYELGKPESELINLDLIQELLVYICDNKPHGAILIFLPGLRDIMQLYDLLQESGRFSTNKFDLYPLHSQLPTENQKMIFDSSPAGIRKIIIATSIAETSITIEDVVYVIDCGQMKLARFDTGLNLEMLKPEWETLANSKQRCGRAGRVKPGECYRLFTRVREATFDHYPTPEIIRTPLEKLILQIKLLQLGRADVFLSNVLDPPKIETIKLAIKLLTDINALDEDENLTPLGYHLARLPVDVRTGKMILWASIFSCVEPVFAIAACLSYKDPFCCPTTEKAIAKKAKHKLNLNQFSDHIAYAEALRIFEKARRKSAKKARKFCSEYFLSFSTLQMLSKMKHEFAMYMYDIQFLKSMIPCANESNRNSNNLSLVKGIVCAGLFPNIAVVQKHARFPILGTKEDGIIKIHPKSVNMEAPLLPTKYVTFYQKKKSTSIFLHDTTCVTENAIIFSTINGQNSKRISSKQLGKRVLMKIYPELELACTQRVGETIKLMKDEFNKLLLKKFLYPSTVNWDSAEGLILEAVMKFLSEADLQTDTLERVDDEYTDDDDKNDENKQIESQIDTLSVY